MEITLFVLSFALLLAIGVPIAFSMILPSFLYLWLVGVPVTVVAQRLFDPLTSPSFLAIPFYILAAEVMNTTGLTERIFLFARKVIGFIPGGLGQANILASMIFAGMSGSVIADAAGLGRIEIKAMTDAGYDLKYSAGITATSAVIGPIIPPSIPLAIYAIIAEQSVARMFIAGMVPGVLIGLCMMLMAFIFAVRKPHLFPRDPLPSFSEFIAATGQAFLPLMLPIIIVGGILTGVFTATEAGAVAVLYALLLALFSRQCSLKDVVTGFRRAMLSTAMVMFILGAALVFSWVITISQLPQHLVAWIFSVVSNKAVILMFIAVLILVMGMFLAGNAKLIILAPILVSMAPYLDINLVHLGVYLVLGVMTATVTPPIGGALFVIADFTGLSVGQVARGALPFLIAIIVAWIIVIFVPETTLFLPRLVWGS